MRSLRSGNNIFLADACVRFNVVKWSCRNMVVSSLYNSVMSLFLKLYWFFQKSKISSTVCTDIKTLSKYIPYPAQMLKLHYFFSVLMTEIGYNCYNFFQDGYFWKIQCFRPWVSKPRELEEKRNIHETRNIIYSLAWHMESRETTDLLLYLFPAFSTSHYSWRINNILTTLPLQ